MTVRTAPAPGAHTIKAVVMKPVFPNPESAHFEYVPASVLDIARLPEGKAVFSAQAGVVDAALAVGKVAVGVAGVELSLVKKSVVVSFGQDVDFGVKSVVRKAVAALNSQLFKLNKVRMCVSATPHAGACMHAHRWGRLHACI